MTDRSALAGSRVLVTGATGFIGRALCEELVGVGAVVHGTARRRRALPERVTWHEADLADAIAADGLVAGVAPEVIYHLAGSVTGVRDVEHVVPVFTATLASTVHLLVAAQRHGCRRVVLAGSMEEPDRDDTLAVPTSPYAAAKWASGGYGRMFASLYGLEVVEVRIFMTYGPGYQPPDKLVPALVIGLLRGEPPTLGSGRRRVDWVYLDDVAGALRRAATADVAIGTRPDIGSGQLLSIREFVTRLARHVDPAATLEFGGREDRPAEREVTADVSGSRRVLGWQPQVDLNEGLARVVAWYRERYEVGEFGRG